MNLKRIGTFVPEAAKNILAIAARLNRPPKDMGYVLRHALADWLESFPFTEEEHKELCAKAIQDLRK